METIRTVSISFQSAGKIFDFEAREFELHPGDKVIVETERGRALGTVVREPREIRPEAAPPKLKTVLRQANEADLQMAEKNSLREADALKFCRKRVLERKMEMKLVRAEYLFDGSKIIFYFTADGRVDFRELVRDLAQHFRTRIEMRQIGVRDEAKLVGGIGVCGRELCCCSYLRNFAPVSVKMAKAQGLALNPTKISGQCGRLLCCLAYEYETYNELRKNLPKCGKKVQLESGPAEVIAVDVLSQKLTVCCSNGERCQLSVADLKKGFNQSPTNQPKSDDRHPATKAKPDSRAETGETSANEGQGKNNRRSGSRNRRQQKPQQTTETQTKQTKEATPGEKQDPDKSQKRRRRRRPRRRPNQPKSPEKNS